MMFSVLSFFDILAHHLNLERNKVDGLIIFDLEEREIEEILGVQNSIHRKRFRNGNESIEISMKTLLFRD